jgi:hypothetical protein
MQGGTEGKWGGKNPKDVKSPYGRIGHPEERRYIDFDGDLQINKNGIRNDSISLEN